MAKVLAPPPASKPLYEEDFPLWAERQAALLRGRAIQRADLDNLIEEVEGLERRERRPSRAHVETIMEHLVKLTLSPAERPCRGWLVTVDRQRAKLARKLTTTLRAHLKARACRRSTPGSDDPWRGSCRRRMLPNVLPPVCPYTLDQLLDPTGTRTTRTGSRQHSRDGAILLMASS